MIPILFQLKIFVAVFSLVHAVSIFLLISIYLFSLAYNKRVLRIHSNTWTWLKSSILKPLLGAIEKRQNKATEVFPIISETFWPLQGKCESRDLELQ